MLARKTVLITDKFSDSALQMLAGQDFLFVRQSASPDLSRENMDGVHALIIRSRTRVDQSLLSRAKGLQVIITCTSGFDHIDLAAAAQWGVTVMFTPKANIESAAQLTWALVLACAQRLPEAQRLVSSGVWKRDQIVGTELSGKTYGVVGLGRIGSRVAEIAKAFHMQIIAYDPYIEESDFQALKAERTSLEDLLLRADVMSAHVPHTAETQNMLGSAEFSQARSLIFVNTSRGSVVDEGALLEALDKVSVLTAGLDVFAKEPLPVSSGLLAHPRVILSPHIGANTTEAFEKASEAAAEKLVRFFVDGTTGDTLPPKAPWYTAQN